jgi:hypothetical protein
MAIPFVKIEKALPQSGVDTGVGRQAITQTDQTDRAVGDLVARQCKWDRRPPVFGQQSIQDGDEIRRRIGQRSIEIEQKAQTAQAASGRVALAR